MTPATKLLIDTLKGYAERGEGLDRAAEALQAPHAYLASFATRHRIRFSHQRQTAERAPFVVYRAAANERSQQIAEMFKQGNTLEQIGARYGITRERVRQILWADHGMRGCDGGQCVSATLARAARLNKIEARHQQKHGCSRAQYKEIVRAGGTRGFTELKRNTKRDGIKLELNLWQWWSAWQASGHWDERGRGRHGYWMFRVDANEPLSLTNYCIAPGGEAMRIMRHSDPLRFRRPETERAA